MNLRAMKIGALAPACGSPQNLGPSGATLTGRPKLLFKTRAET